MNQTRIYPRLLLLACLLPLCVYGCTVRSAFGLPSPKEEGVMLKQEIEPSMRLAVIVKQENTVYEVPGFGFAEDIAAEVASQSEQLFGTESIAIDHTEGSDWIIELERARKVQNDWKSTRGEHDEFFRTQGFDLYVEVITYPQATEIGTPMISLSEMLHERRLSDQMKDTLELSRSIDNLDSVESTPVPQERYKPIYRIFKVQQSGEVKRLAVDGAKSEIVCTANSGLGECATKFGQSIKQMLERRLSLASG